MTPNAVRPREHNTGVEGLENDWIENGHALADEDSFEIHFECVMTEKLLLENKEMDHRYQKVVLKPCG
ncbi:MAG: hypothetical protein WA485_03735 [Candidatus Sulfotelmatobacter sp.]